MSDVSYRPLVEDMQWSYSRLNTFDDCAYGWFLHYICKCPKKEKFYSSYGTLMHELLEQYYRGELSKDDMLSAFLLRAPEISTVSAPKPDTIKKYIDGGVEYLKSFSPLPYKMIDVEHEVKFSIFGIPFVGFIDYIGEKDGELYIVDHKSRDLRPRSKRATPTQNDMELDAMLRQLYIYSYAIKLEFGKFPKALCFNCFRTGTLIEEPFNENKYNETIKWACDTINYILRESETGNFDPNIDIFKCYYICEYSDECCYFADCRGR